MSKLFTRRSPFDNQHQSRKGFSSSQAATGLQTYRPTQSRKGRPRSDIPEKWWRATIIAVREALEKADRPQILGIGFSGQMHGLVLLDQRKKPVRPAIIWADQRSVDLLPELRERVGLSLLAQQCGTAPATGFLIAKATAPSSNF